jgi:hypothetical protein
VSQTGYKQSCIDPKESRKLYNSKRASTDKRKFHKSNNQYVNGALYDHIPSSCAKIIPDNDSNSRLVIKVHHIDGTWSNIVITKYSNERVKKLNHLTLRLHEAFESVSSGKWIQMRSMISCYNLILI